MRHFKPLLFVVAFLASHALSPVMAQDNWGGGFDVNKTINETNFIVGRGCSGTLISKLDRLILTNHHCIDNAIRIVTEEVTNDEGVVKKIKKERLNNITVAQKDYSGHDQVGKIEYVTKIVAKAKKRDLALLQLIGKNLRSSIHSPLLPPGKSVLRGSSVWIVGNPYGFDATVSRGIVSNTTRRLKVPWADGEDINFYQTDAIIAPGNSGGSAYNSDGYLIGVPAAAIPGVLGLIITTEQVREFLEKNCWASVYDPRADGHDACVEAKKKKAEEKKAKSG